MKTRWMLLLVALCTASCGDRLGDLAPFGAQKSSVPAAVQARDGAPPPGSAGRLAVADEQGGTSPQSGAAAGPLESLWSARKLIRNASLEIEVQTFDKAAAEVARIASRHKGFVADAQVTRNRELGGKRSGTLTVRIPAESFDAAVADMKQLGTVEREDITTQDVTKAYTDLETRLGVKRQTEARLREILANRTGSISDVLQVENELSRVVEQIEQMEGEKRYYDQQVAVSTIAVDMYEPRALVRAGSMSPIRKALRDALKVLSASVAVFIYAAAFLVPWVVLFVILWFGIRTIRRRHRARIAS